MQLSSTQLRKIELADEELVRTVDAAVGGARERNDILDWAQRSLSAHDKADYQAGLNNPETALEAIRDLKRRRDGVATATALEGVKAAGGFTSHTEYWQALREQGAQRSAAFMERVRQTPQAIIEGWDGD